MAEKRMFSRTIIDSDLFLEMPATAQALYFHLSMRADDDGFVNKPRAVMRICGAKDDDMNILIAKQFIIPFESGIVVIRHWKIHNYIRKDVYRETVYGNEKQELSVIDGAYEKQSLQVRDDIGTGTLQVRNEDVTNSLIQDRINKNRDRLDKDNYSLVNTDECESNINCKQIMNLFCEVCVSLPKPYNINDSRRKRIKQADKELKGDFKGFFERIEKSDFLTGRVENSRFKASFDWVLKPANLVKIMEGNYDNDERNNNNAYIAGYDKYSEEVI